MVPGGGGLVERDRTGEKGRHEGWLRAGREGETLWAQERGVGGKGRWRALQRRRDPRPTGLLRALGQVTSSSELCVCHGQGEEVGTPPLGPSGSGSRRLENSPSGAENPPPPAAAVPGSTGDQQGALLQKAGSRPRLRLRRPSSLQARSGHLPSHSALSHPHVLELAAWEVLGMQVLS